MKYIFLWEVQVDTKIRKGITEKKQSSERKKIEIRKHATNKNKHNKII